MASPVTLSNADKDAAFAREALPCTDSVYRFARALCRDAADADDLVQDTFLRAYRSWHTFAEGSDCRRWLFTICRNVFLGRAARARVTVSLDDPDGGESQGDVQLAAAAYATGGEAGSADIFTRLDVQAALKRALATLPEPYRSTLQLVDVEDQSYEAAAEVLGVPMGTVRSRLFRARRMVQGQLLAVANDAGVALDRRARRAS